MVAGRSSLVTAKDPRASHRVGNSDQMPTEWARGAVDDVVMRLRFFRRNNVARLIRTTCIPLGQRKNSPFPFLTPSPVTPANDN